MALFLFGFRMLDGWPLVCDDASSDHLFIPYPPIAYHVQTSNVRKKGKKKVLEIDGWWLHLRRWCGMMCPVGQRNGRPQRLKEMTHLCHREECIDIEGGEGSGRQKGLARRRRRRRTIYTCDSIIAWKRRAKGGEWRLSITRANIHIS